mgnify:CR=1 FL=1
MATTVRMGGDLHRRVGPALGEERVEAISVRRFDPCGLLIRLRRTTARRERGRRAIHHTGARPRRRLTVDPAPVEGRLGRDGRQQFGFVKYLASDQAALAKALAVPVESLDENQALLADW